MRKQVLKVLCIIWSLILLTGCVSSDTVSTTVALTTQETLVEQIGTVMEESSEANTETEAETGTNDNENKVPVLPSEEFVKVEKETVEDITEDMHFDYPYQADLYMMCENGKTSGYSYEDIETLFDNYGGSIRKDLTKVIRVMSDTIVVRHDRPDVAVNEPAAYTISQRDWTLEYSGRKPVEVLSKDDYVYFDDVDYIKQIYKQYYGSDPMPEADTISYQYGWEPMLRIQVETKCIRRFTVNQIRQDYDYDRVLLMIGDICKEYDISPNDIECVAIDTPRSENKNYVYLHIEPKDSSHSIGLYRYRFNNSSYSYEPVEVNVANSDINS